jgi:hypothetical protein
MFITHKNPGDKLSITAAEWNTMADAVNSLVDKDRSRRRAKATADNAKGAFDIAISEDNGVVTATLYNSGEPIYDHNDYTQGDFAGIVQLPSSNLYVPEQSITLPSDGYRCLYLAISYNSGWSAEFKVSYQFPVSFLISNNNNLVSINRILAIYSTATKRLQRLTPLGIIGAYDIWD